MDFELLNNNHHQNNLALYKCISNKGINYKKLSLSKKSNLLIENEKAGYSWFFSNLAFQDKTELSRGYYYEIDIPEFEGKSFTPDAILTGNKNIIFNFISFYRKIWNSKDNFSIHGDLALCNIIHKYDDEFMVIDWEHFHSADFDYFGYDIINLLFISLHHEFKGITRISDNIFLFMNECFKALFKDISTHNKIVSSPFKNACEYLKKNQSKYNLNIPVENKFVLSRYSSDELANLDSMIMG